MVSRNENANETWLHEHDEQEQQEGERLVHN